MQPALSPTIWMLMAEYQSTAVPLESCLKYLGYATIGEANRAARDNELPVPTFLGKESKRGARMVHLTDLANHIDSQHRKATASWNAANGIEEPASVETKPRRQRGQRRPAA
ncbi:MAG: pyocin activator PrtN family protein [Amphritea sp.]|nr:pyocin activator PrtN family protein [Amphritea sp.]